MKRIVSLLCVVALVLCLLPHATLLASAAGTCGANLTWTFNESSGLLTISGTGEMTNWSSSEQVPWYSQKEQILNVTVEEQVKSIGSYAFSGCSNLVRVSLPSSLGQIGDYAFADCAWISQITLPEQLQRIGTGAFQNCSRLNSIDLTNLTSIGAYAFNGCSSLQSIVLSDRLVTINNYAFCNCSSLTNITIPKSVTRIGASAFDGCSNLTNVYYDGTLEECIAVVLGSGNVALQDAEVISETITGNYFGFITILTAEDLYLINNNLSGRFIMMADIDLSEALAENGVLYNPDGWVPIGSRNTSVAFSGVFDGNGHKILGMTCTGQTAGLFYKNSGTIQNVSVYGEITRGKDEYIEKAGGICTENSGTICGCDSHVKIIVYRAGSSGFGGIAGYNSGTITLCQNFGKIHAREFNYDNTNTIYAGGICGKSTSALYKVANWGEVYCDVAVGYAYCGGIAGTASGVYYAFNGGYVGSAANYSLNSSGPISSKSGGISPNSSVSNALNVGHVYATTSAYGISGGTCGYSINIGEVVQKNGTGVQVNGATCYYLTGGASATGTGLSIAQMSKQVYFTNLDFDSIWTMGECGHPYPVLQFMLELNANNNSFTQLRHEYIEESTTDATCTEGGYTTYTCEYCKDSYNDNYIEALGHSFTAWYDAVQATCTEPGQQEHHCTRCSTTETRPIGPLGHNIVVEAAAVAPTCTTPGLSVGGHCSRCSYVAEQQVIPALGHDFVDHAAQRPTCTAVGWDAYQTCTRCDYSTYVEKPALGHAYVNHAAQQPTCTSVGWNAYQTCSRCDYSSYVEIAALDHDFIYHDAKPATCTTSGWNVYLTCSRCDYSTYSAISALGHDLTNHLAKAPTCTAVGWEAYQTCSRCDYSTYEEIAALGHNWIADEENSEAATCINTGVDAFVCTRCTATREEQVDALGHDIINHAAQAATCTEAGWYAYQTCSRCDYTTYKAIPKLGHDFEVTVVSPTCTERGYTYYECTREGCGYTEKGYWTNSLGHDYIDHPAKAATCTENGWSAYQTCSRCDYTTYKEIAALGHNIVVDAAVPPTCTENGLTAGEHCTRCDYAVPQEIIPARGHAHTHVEHQDATCTEPGYDKTICDDCGNVISDTIIPARGHDYINHQVKEATCTEKGWNAYQTCRRCDYTTYKEIPALGHDIVVTDDAVAATCTTTGLTEGKHCTRCDYAVEQETIPALGHDILNHSAKAATCTEKGWNAYQTCTRCDFTTYQELPALGHDIVVDTAVSPTCTSSGLTAGEHCTRCEYRIAQIVVPALGHALISHEAKAATCTETGWNAYQTCNRCEYTTFKEIPALGHDIVIDVAIAATCTETGLTAGEHCTRCDYKVEQEVILALGHEHAHPEHKDATCVETGYDRMICDDCGTMISETIIPALGHDILKDNAVAATCTETGLTAGEHCTRCEYKVVQETVPALGHDWNDGEVTTPATVTTDGVKTFTCNRCGATKTETIPATGGEDKPCDGGPSCPSYKFTDVKAGDWYHEAVDFAVKNGLFNGMSDTTFEPNTPMTRGMLVTVLWRYEGQPEGGTNNFADVKDGEWYAKAVAWAASKGIVNGVGNGKFDPNGKVTREQLAAILFRYSESKGYDTSKTGNLNTFPDAAKVSDWAKSAYSWAVGEGLIGGNVINGKTLLDPQGNATRAQVATILMRFIQNVAQAE